MDNDSIYSCADGSGLSSNSVTEDYWDSTGDGRRSYALATALLTLIIVTVGVPSNLLIIAGILKQHLYREPTYILLLNLTFADLLLCIFLIPSPVIAGLAGEFLFGRNDVTRCRICQLATILTVFLTIMIQSVAFLSVDRLIFIKYPMKYHQFVTVKRVHISMIITWVVGAAFSAFPYFGLGDLSYNHHLATCAVNPIRITKLAKNIYYWVILAIFGTISLVTLLTANIWIGCIVRKHIMNIYSLKDISVSDDEFVNKIKVKMSKTKNKKHLQVVKVTGSIIAFSMIAWSPFVVYTIYSAFYPPNLTADVMVYIFIVSAAAIHPIIQAIHFPELKKYFISLLCCYGKKSSGYLRMCNEEQRCTGHSLMNCHCLFLFNFSFLPSEAELETEQF